MKLRFGILGTGNIAKQFATGVTKSTLTTLTAVGSRTTASADAFAKQFGIANAHGSYDALLTDPAVDAIYLSLPNNMHHEWTIKALRAGKHVLCEKPLATSLAEAEEMFGAAERSGRVLVEAFMYRAHPQTIAAVKAIREGAIGKVRVIRTSFCYRTRKIEGNIRFDPTLAGGALMDIGCYCLDFSRLVAGAEPTGVSAEAIVGPQGVDTLVSGSLKFGDDCVANFVCGMTAQADNAALVCGEEGWIRIPVPWKPLGHCGFTIERQTPPKQDGGAATRPPLEKIDLMEERDVYGIEADAFASVVLNSAAPFMSKQDSLGTIQLLDKVRTAMRDSPIR